jgi:predicted porin
MTQGMKRVSLVLAAALGIGVASPARATIGVKAGAWDLEFSGDVNAFATYNLCDDSDPAAIVGGQACQRGEDAPNAFAIESGLLPNAFVFSAKSRQMNLDVGATIGIYPSISTRDGAATPNIDARQGFITLGDKSWGSVKIGRDLGIFAGEAILSDMTLQGVGVFGAWAGARVTFGHIGTGYVYADWIPQIAYTSPSFSGLQFAVGVFQGLNVGSTDGFDDLDLDGEVDDLVVNPLTGHQSPMVQAKVSYDIPTGGPIGARIFASGLYQNVSSSADKDDDIHSIAGEGGIKIKYAGLEVFGYGYYGQGIGTTIIGNLAADGLEERDSWGYMGQVTYKIGKLKPGISYGESRLKMADDDTVGDVLVKRNATLTAGLYYSITDSVTLVGEYNGTWAENHADDDAMDNSFSVGSILFF